MLQVVAWRMLIVALISNGVAAYESSALRSGRNGNNIVLGTRNILAEEFSHGDFKAVLPEEVPEIFPVPTSSRCIVMICCQYMVIYTALAIYRTYCEFSGESRGTLEASLRAAAQTQTYGPMLCVLFIACRMRVEFLSNGKGEPQLWVQCCMYGVTFSVLASTLAVLFMPLILGKPMPLKEGTCDLEKFEESQLENRTLFIALTTLRYLILLGLYGGLIGIIVGTCTYLPPGDTTWSDIPAPAPAILCTMILAMLFFLFQLVIAVCRTYGEFTGRDFPALAQVMEAAANSIEFAPMMAILFLAARMRALQHGGQPQAWAQTCMYFSTLGLCSMTVLSICVPLAFGGSVERDESINVQRSSLHVSPLVGCMLIAGRYVCLLSFYAGTLGVICSIFTFVSPAGPKATLPLSPTVQCVIIMACQFFFVYFVQFVMLTVSEVTNGRVPMETWVFFMAVDAAKATLQFAPMLSILFVTTRMYALLITDGKGAPQAWVQDGMFMATWSLMISFVMCLVAGVLSGGDVKTDEDGNVINTFTNQYVGIGVTSIRYLSMILLYVGMVSVIVGLFVMTPETANGRGSVPVASDAVNATPFGKPPPGPNSAADSARAGHSLQK